jgi:hypothetical protein
MKRKRLGGEWKNTYIIEFLEKAQPKRLLAVLEKLKMISVEDVSRLWNMDELKSSDECFNSLCEAMNHIAPEGCTFQVQNSYQKLRGGDRLIKHIRIGFYS